MLMAAAAMHMDSTHPSSTGSIIISPPPWHPAVPVPVPTHHHQQDLSAPSPSPSPSPPPRNNHHLRPAAARRPSSRRRPRPSRKVPTTYITADAASFRRMVHQVTGADDLPPLAPQHEATTLCRPAPSRAAAAGALPTLDTSALLLGNSDGGSGSGSARGTLGPDASVHLAAASEVDVGAGVGVRAGLGVAGYSSSDCGAGAGGFPTLESWDALLY
ncbi:unnamed protein product [Miscanthus lutarioriparius]|uniref:VQ domain-containing protein n=1 Tax=Miscanthus lutarioriparius TaxID=422564 RepID=A0A811QLL4_9POAL|nr:unnamed protein product [Miscanthus lutarioriparius]